MKLLMFRDSDLPGCDAISLGEWFMFQRIKLSSSSKVSGRHLLGMLTVEHEKNKILRKVWEHVSDDAAPYPKRFYSPGAPLPELQNSRFMYPYKNFRSKADEIESMGPF
jgi:hypothetical protein